MAVPAQAISPEALAEARRLYELSNVPVQNVADMLGISKSTLNARIRRWGWARRAHRIPADIGAGVGGPGGTLSGPDAPYLEPTLPEPSQAAPSRPAEPAHAGPAARPSARDRAPAASAVEAREALIGRLVTRIEAEISAVERILARAGSASPGRGAAEAERAARTLGVLVRSLRELTALARGAAEAEDEPARDAEDFRRDLAATLERVLAGPLRR